MTRKKLNRLKREHAQLYAGSQKAFALQALAARLGRKLVKRGKEPVWRSDLPGCFPLAIPDHGGRDLAPGTKKSILDQLESDLLAWDEIIEDHEEDDDSVEG